MSITTVMARFLDQELQTRGVQNLSLADCEEISEAVLRRTAEFSDAGVAEHLRKEQPPEH